MQALLFDNRVIEVDPESTRVGGSWQKWDAHGTPISWETEPVKFIHDVIQKFSNPVIIDVGANTGTYCLLSALNPDISGFAFEPAPKIYDLLNKNLQLNNIQDKIITVNAALADKKGTTRLKIPKSGNESGLACIGTPLRYNDWEEIEIPVTTLDLFAEQHTIKRVDILKIDTEGCELFVLLGAERLIKRDYPGILLEYHAPNTRQFGYEPDDLQSLLRSWGYDNAIKVSNEDVFFYKTNSCISSAIDGNAVVKQPMEHSAVTLFTVPKPFRGHIGTIQRNAILSWLKLKPQPEIILMGNEFGTQEIARELNLRHEPSIASNEHGTPLISSIFERAQQLATNEILAYVNTDIIFTQKFSTAIQAINKQSRFLVVGRRWDIDVWQSIDFDDAEWDARLEDRVRKKGLLHASTGIDYFIFRKGLYRDIPPFAIGRTVWDNWLLWEVKRQGARLIDATRVIDAIHQEHDYKHVKGGAEEAWRGVEARRNRELASGHTMTITHADFCIEGDRVVSIHGGYRYPEPTRQDYIDMKYRQSQSAYLMDEYEHALDLITYIELDTKNCILPYNFSHHKAKILLALGRKDDAFALTDLMTATHSSLTKADEHNELELEIKASHELAYWAQRKQQEGSLANDHYERFYTEFFGLDRSFYAGKCILDIGCGPRGSLEWADMVKERIGLDPLAKQYMALGADKHKMRYVAACSEAMPFPNDYFDIVTSFNSLDHVENLNQSIAEIMRVIKPGGMFLLLSDVNHDPTPCEPIEFSWDIVEKFQPKLKLVDKKHFEKPKGLGLYQSLNEAIVYDHTRAEKRYGIIAANFIKPVSSNYPVISAQAAGTENYSDSNNTAFNHLQNGFNLLKERCFAEASYEIKLYKKLVNYQKFKLSDKRKEQYPKISVVIVAYKIGQGLIQCLDSIVTSNNPTYEVIVVDNGGNEDIASELSARPILHVQVGFNVMLAEGRNIGVYFVRAPIVSFIDDDALVMPGYLASVLEAFETYDIQGFRGKVLPRTDDENNQKASHYDLGMLPIPTVIDAEGNSAFLTDSWRQLGGQDPLLFGGEGLDLSYRAYQVYGNYKTIYWPWSIIYHDYAAIPGKLEAKQERHRLMREYSEFKHPALYSYHKRLDALTKTEAARQTGNELIPRRADKASGTCHVFVANSNPFISVCIPTYNRAAFIESTVQSVIGQSYQNHEILIVDDGSIDDTQGIVKRLASEKLRYVRKEHSGGPATRNRCIVEASSDFIVWLDSDDLIMPHTLETYADVLIKNPDVDVLYGDLLVFNDNGAVSNIWSYRDFSSERQAFLPNLFLKNVLPNVCTMVRKSCYENIGGYDEKFRRAHDYEFWARLATTGKFRHVKRVVGEYRQHDNSLSGGGGRTENVFEAEIFHKMLIKYTIEDLFAYCYREHFPDERSQAHALKIAACVALKWCDVCSAQQLVKRSVEHYPLESAVRLNRFLELLYKQANDDSLKTSRIEVNDHKYERSLSLFVQCYYANDLSSCAQACSEIMGQQPGSVESLLAMAYCLNKSKNYNSARTAFDVLVNRQIDEVYADIVSTGIVDELRLASEWAEKWKL